MTPIQRAMLWELYRTTRIDFLSRISILVGGVVLVWLAPAVQEMSEPEVQVTNGVFFFMLSIISASAASCWMQLDRQITGFSFRLGFTRPVSSVQLVALPMILTIAGAIVCYAIPVSLLNVLLHRALPIIAPSALIACVAACFMAACWSPRSLVAKLIGVTLLAVSVIGLILIDHARRGDTMPILMAVGRGDYFHFTWPIYLGLIIVSGLALLVTIVSVDLQRHGETWLTLGSTNQSGLTAGAQATGTTTPLRRIRFRSRFQAQCGYEYQRFGRTVLLFAATIAIAALAFVTLMPLIYAIARPGPGIVQSWLMVLALSPLALQIIGLSGAISIHTKDGVVKYPAFDATRPLTNEQLVTVKLLMVTACAFSGWLIIILTAGGHLYLSGTWPVVIQMLQAVGEALGGVTTLQWVAALMCALFQYISSCSVLMVFGLWIALHGRIFLGLALFTYASAVLFVVDLSHKATFQWLWEIYTVLLAIAILLICCVALYRAFRAGVMRSPLFLSTFGLWLVYVATTVVLLLKFVPENTPFAYVSLGLASLLIPLAATAVTPLALAAHRHG